MELGFNNHIKTYRTTNTEHRQYSLVTVLLLAVRAVRVLTSHRKIALSRPAEATCSLSLAYANAFT
jgi:hypothetical protein